jgi:hypothetical protein
MAVLEDFASEVELITPEELERAGLEEFLPVYEEACELLEEWHAQHGGTHPVVSANLLYGFGHVNL